MKLDTGVIIRMHRAKLKMTQTDLGQILGKCAFTISKWEDDINHPLSEEVPKVCKALQIDPNTYYQWGKE